MTRTFHMQLTISNSYGFRYRPRRRCEHNIKMDLEEIGGKDVDLTDIVQDRDKSRTSRPAEKLLAFRE